MSSFAALSVHAREQEVRSLVELVRLSRVTLLVAEDGSDKSAVLRSMVMPLLQGDGSDGTKEIAVLMDWWEKAPLAVLNARIDEALARVVGDAAYAMEDRASSDPLPARLAARQRAFACKFVIVFDRFEEYLATPVSDEIREFEAQFVEAVNSPAISASFVLSLDERAGRELARLHERIPGLGDAQVRLSKLEPERAPHTSPRAETFAERLVGSRPSLEPTLLRHADSAAETGTAAPATAPRHEVHDQARDEVEAPTIAAETRNPVAAHAVNATPKRSRTRAAIALVIVLMIVSLVALLGIRRAGEAERGPVAGAVSPPGAASAPESSTETAATSNVETPSAGNSGSGAIVPAEVPQPQVAPDTAPAAASPSPSNAGRAAAPSSATGDASARLDIVIGSEAQREYAERLAAPLARRGIRVGGIRVAPGGPPVSDLRYFHSADRAEAVAINRALDVAGRPAQRLRYVPGYEGRERRNQYELWLPAS